MRCISSNIINSIIDYLVIYSHWRLFFDKISIDFFILLICVLIVLIHKFSFIVKHYIWVNFIIFHFSQIIFVFFLNISLITVLFSIYLFWTFLIIFIWFFITKFLMSFHVIFPIFILKVQLPQLVSKYIHQY